jgi:hypothetical protein
MSTVQTPTQNFTINTVSFGTLTVSANDNANINNLYAGLIGNLVDSHNAANLRVIIVRIEDYGTITCNSCPNNNYTTSVGIDLISYVGGIIYFEPQIIEVNQNSAEPGMILRGEVGTGDPPSPVGLPENYLYFKILE